MEHLKLKHQLCFRLYAASRLIIREYQPYLEELQITYPQYLVLLVLWEKDQISVQEIASMLVLNTNTVTPLLKRMENQGLIFRKRQQKDERIVIVSLTQKGIGLKSKAAAIPGKMASRVTESSLSIEDLSDLKEKLQKIITALDSKPIIN
jgi:MarR family transcriptional regulator, organic hydroperoxide resistance regulator